MTRLVSAKSLSCVCPLQALPDVAFPPVGRLGLTSPPSSVLCDATTATCPSRVLRLSLASPIPCVLLVVCGLPAGLVAWSKRPDHARAFGHPVPHSGYVVKETGGSPKFPSSPCEDMPRSSGRNTARATVGREFPTCTLSVVQRVPSSAIAHVSVSPPLIPDGRISRVRLAVSDLHALSPQSLPTVHGGLSARPHTPLIHMVCFADSPRLR